MKRLLSGRIIILSCGVVLARLGIALRLFFIQIRQHEFYRTLALSQHMISQELAPKRGDIFLQDRSKSGTGTFTEDLMPIAVTKKGFFAYAIPRDIPRERVGEISKMLSEELGLDAAIVEQRLAKRADPYEPLKNRLTDAEVAQLNTWDFPGVELGEESWRYYPAEDLAEPFLGFVGNAGNGSPPRGLYGIERQYDAEDLLAGEEGFRGGDRDALGALIPFRVQKEKPPINGKIGRASCRERA